MPRYCDDDEGMPRASSPEPHDCDPFSGEQQMYQAPAAPSRSPNWQAKALTHPIPTPRHGHGRTIPGRNLTGQVRKTSQYYFATGGYADVWEASLREDNKVAQVAVKVLRNITTEYTSSERLQKRLEREAQVWGSLKHPNITPFLGFCYDLGRPSIPSLVSPYYRFGNINDYLLKDDADVFRLTAAGLHYLHSQSPVVIHGDIKGSNILIDDERNARLSDFGLSRMLETTGYTTKSIAGSCRWMAYELMYSDEDDDDKMPFTEATDIWAFGMTVLEVLTRRPPFMEHKHDTAVVLALARQDRPQRPTNCREISDAVWTVIEHCWKPEPLHRPPSSSIGLAMDLLLGLKDYKLTSAHMLALLQPEQRPRDVPVKTVTNETDTSDALCKCYRCKWPNCTATLENFDEMVRHECSESNAHKCPEMFPRLRSSASGKTVTEYRPTFRNYFPNRFSNRRGGNF